jgi:hypothetical protein
VHKHTDTHKNRNFSYEDHFHFTEYEYCTENSRIGSERFVKSFFYCTNELSVLLLERALWLLICSLLSFSAWSNSNFHRCWSNGEQKVKRLFWEKLSLSAVSMCVCVCDSFTACVCACAQHSNSHIELSVLQLLSWLRKQGSRKQMQWPRKLLNIAAAKTPSTNKTFQNSCAVACPAIRRSFSAAKKALRKSFYFVCFLDRVNNIYSGGLVLWLPNALYTRMDRRINGRM